MRQANGDHGAAATQMRTTGSGGLLRRAINYRNHHHNSMNKQPFIAVVLEAAVEL
jgi:hypothetical protein